MQSSVTVTPQARDIRLDFFRGLALVFIFLDHIPDNVVSWATIRNYGFSDATEIFVFISGYSAALAYGRRLGRDGLLFTAARIWKRCWQLYIAQTLLFIGFTAQIAYTATHFNNPMFSEEMNIVGFLNAPHVTILQALLLRFRPANMDILPLYIVLLLVFPLILWGLSRRAAVVLAASAALYVAAVAARWNLDTWPEGKWLFNPFAWQLLFVIGAALGLSRGHIPWLNRRHPVILGVAIAYLALALFLALSWRIPGLERIVPDFLESALYPIDKTNLDILRLLHFFALALVVISLVPVDSRVLHWRLLQPIERCGQHSLEVFCLGVLLSFAGHMVLVEIDESLPMQFAISLGGIALMIGTGYYLQWYRRRERASGGKT
jgi:hypothetical protein